MNKMLSVASKLIPELPPIDGSDEDLLERMRSDDVEAYRVLVERNIDRAYAVAMRVLKNPADAEDVTQDAFVKAWVNRQRWDAGRAKFSTWLYRVIVNRCIDKQRLLKTEWLDEVDEPVADIADAVTVIHRQRVYGRLEDALQRLPTQQRIALVLSYYEDMSNLEVADVMGTTVGAVESLLKRGRKRLRELLRWAESEIRTGFGD
ncbi:sigma-70 family RNA polymerase sigma factor [Telmatospirillum sp.]|uniref:sigma-70 family RNA polymerase sigma factor n=1 Tax=Telmatospirillum sp. TaxID=2079197 RepID=UPI00283C1779|nr:sigma-70 family RNA polymerase sigma factor [Telmatospirillum sp.]MDR3441303.1 sigma-70 family RNA polymerase sigma factor [Telmatospirillum sp.]